MVRDPGTPCTAIRGKLARCLTVLGFASLRSRLDTLGIPMHIAALQVDAVEELTKKALAQGQCVVIGLQSTGGSGGGTCGSGGWAS